MTNQLKPGRVARTLTLAALVAGGLSLVSGAALAGECPPDKVRIDATKNAGHAAKGVTDKVLSSLDLAMEKIAAKGYTMRVRQLVIQPGGIVPWHSHAERPALIYVVSGQILEHASNCMVPIVHKAGEVGKEPKGTSHWWQNTGKVPVVLLSFDILHDPNDKNM
jgi:quercetin dioxygenase-like cupin family protein